jgi:hypothetical protein
MGLKPVLVSRAIISVGGGLLVVHAGNGLGSIFLAASLGQKRLRRCSFRGRSPVRWPASSLLASFR